MEPNYLHLPHYGSVNVHFIKNATSILNMDALIILNGDILTFLTKSLSLAVMVLHHVAWTYRRWNLSCKGTLLKARLHFVCVDFEQPADVRETIKALALHSLKISVTLTSVL